MTVANLDRTRGFYTDVLQFTPVAEKRENERSTATLPGLHRAKPRTPMLITSAANATRNPTHGSRRR